MRLCPAGRASGPLQPAHANAAPPHRDQLYFDRVHSFMPMIHRRQYNAWSKLGTKSDIQVCLQHVMWTLAAALSAQYQHVCDLLYMKSRQALEIMDVNQDDTESIPVEQIQAWLLITVFEFLRTSYHRGCVSAGRSFRLIQLTRLYEVDLERGEAAGHRGASTTGFPGQTTWVDVEVRRRTFWCAYILDRLISLRKDCPLTLNEQSVC